ncbi:MAG: ABC transporter substrate-binding protein, partial [candidate division Zixibacteria bacterium]|nr:ABC transporter substrate-binding protein [candidate division Zixibacteria bacterium]
MYQIIDDFLINSDTFGGSEQSYAAVARDAAGNFVIAWEDYRSGHSDIYFQRCDSYGNPLGSNFKVNDDNGSASQYNPAIAMDRSGNFVLTWIDGRNGNYDIYAQRYDSSGCALDYNFKVNDDANFTKQVANAVAMTGSGSFAIVWQDYRNGNYDIYAQRYDSSGGSLGSNSKVNDDTGSAQQFWPDIAMDVSGNFAVTWLDYRDDYNEIYLQRYDSGGNPLGSNFKVNWTAGSIGKRYPAIAMDHSGNFVVTWQDHKPGMDHYSDVYAQRYDSQGNPIDSNLKVNDVSDSAYYYDILDIAMDSSGTFVITWTDRRDGSHDIYAQIYNSGGPQEGYGPNSKYLFLTNNGLLEMFVTSLSYLKELHPEVKTIVHTMADDGQIPDVQPILKKVASALGFTIVGDIIGFSNETVDFAPITQKCLATGADAIMVGNGGTTSSSGILRIAREMGYTKPIFGTNINSAAEILELAGKEASTNYFIHTVTPNTPDMPARAKEVAELAVAKYGRFELCMCFGFNGIYTMVQAIEKAQSFDPATVRDTWEKMDTI